MKRREQALLLLREAAQDESLLDEVLADPDNLTPLGAVYRYDDYDEQDRLSRRQTRSLLRSLRDWVEGVLEARAAETGIG